MIRRLPAPAGDAALLVTRLLIGVVLIAHGWQKLATNGLDATAAGFAGMGIPAAPAAAVFAIAVELVGGALLVVGAATALVGLLVALDMLGAALFAHLGSGVFVRDGGWELVGAIGAAALALAAAGAGRFAVDHLAGQRRRARVAA